MFTICTNGVRERDNSIDFIHSHICCMYMCIYDHEERAAASTATCTCYVRR